MFEMVKMLFYDSKGAQEEDGGRKQHESIEIGGYECL